LTWYLNPEKAGKLVISKYRYPFPKLQHVTHPEDYKVNDMSLKILKHFNFKASKTGHEIITQQT
jgi:hypothetical protein